MNENINLCEILKDVPKGTEFYSSVYGDVKFEGVGYNVSLDPTYIRLTYEDGNCNVTKEGYHYEGMGECTLFPSKDQRDWSQYKYEPANGREKKQITLHPFDRVLVRDTVAGRFNETVWRPAIFSHIDAETDPSSPFPYITLDEIEYELCVPYNEETKHLFGTKDEPPYHYDISSEF